MLRHRAKRASRVGALQEQMHAARDRQRRGESDQLPAHNVDIAELQVLGAEAHVDGMHVRAEDHEREIDECGRYADGREDLDVRVGREQRLDDEALDQHAEGEQKQGDRHRGYIRVPAELRGEQPHGVHADHQQFAVREVDHPHDAEDQRQADADDRVRAAQQQAVDEKLQKNGHALFLETAQRVGATRFE
ncbi:hypothetical protein NK8_69370 (plasmid) [Caballeronia sp. NK8]|nr:hypothetical protein NK8_69370 [Caballeronia sp. NK8]